LRELRAAALALAGVGSGSGSSSSYTVSSTALRGFQAVALDVDRDGDLDIVFPSQTTNELNVRLNNGSGVFGAVTGYALNDSPVSVATGDIDSDGYTDLLFGQYTQYELTDVSAGLSFVNANDSAPITGCYGVTMYDLDRTGTGDVIATHYTANQVEIATGIGGGALNVSVYIAVGTGPVGVSAGDFDRDGYGDLVVANSGSDNVSVILSDGVGGYDAAVNYAVGTTPIAVALGDFNRDGSLDLVTANASSNNVSVRLGAANGTFGAVASYTVGTNPVSVVVFDSNSDGIPDLGVSNRGSDNVSVLLGVGDGTFGAATNTAVGDEPVGLVAGDFDRNGEVDLVVTHAASTNVQLISSAASGAAGTLANGVAVLLQVGSNPQYPATADFDKDGDMDLVAVGSTTDRVYVVSNDGVGGFSAAAGSPYAETGGGAPMGVATADFNRDGWEDFVITNRGLDEVVVYLNDGDGTFTRQATVACPNYGSPQGVVAVDLNKDGFPDVATVNDNFGGASGIEVFLNNGAGVLNAPTGYASTVAASNPRSIFAEDLDKDGDLDLVVALRDNGEVGRFLNNGTGGFGAIARTTIGDHGAGTEYPVSIRAGDFNRDGNIDVAATLETDFVGLLWGDGAGAFPTQNGYDIGGAGLISHDGAVADFNFDGFLDVFVFVNNPGIGTELFYGDGTTGATGMTSVGTNTGCDAGRHMVTADFDRDGAPDVAGTCDTTGEIYIYLSN